MKRRAPALVLALLGGPLVGGAVWAGIEGSKHDFRKEAWSGGDACAACHSPRAELPPEAPLWDPGADLSVKLGERRDIRLPGAGTTVCMRCHDGTVASIVFTGKRAERFVNTRNPARFSTGHRETDHPVGVAYPRFDREYHPPTSVEASGQVRLPQGRVECTSCHDPHNLAGEKYMLVMSNARSALCLKCHDK